MVASDLLKQELSPILIIRLECHARSQKLLDTKLGVMNYLVCTTYHHAHVHVQYVLYKLGEIKAQRLPRCIANRSRYVSNKS